MAYETLISTGDLAPNLGDPDWAIIDCRFSLDSPEQGRKDYLRAHIPTAVYAHLNEDLSGLVIEGKTGRHPLPPMDRFIQTLSDWGIDPQVQVVIYDDQGGAYAARLWWMLHWLGHEAAAVLDGGWPKWKSEKRPAESGEEKRPHRTFVPRLHPRLLVSGEEVDAMRYDPAFRIFDARSADRYRGENENRDPVAGHIPGALSAPYSENLASDGSFLPVDKLREMYEHRLGDTQAENAVFYCGSGVTAAHDLLAMAHTGLGKGRMYLGSWSEWITNPVHPIVSAETVE